MKMKIFILTILCLFIAGTTLTAPAESARFQNHPPSKEQREKIRKKIEVLRIWKLTEALDLDENTSSRLFPILKKYDRKRAVSQKSFITGLKELRESLKENREDNLKDIIDKLERNHMELERINNEERNELKTILSVKQQAQYILFQLRFKRELQRFISEARKKRQGGDFRRDRRENP
ncbi:hypothetical protein BMS3Abin07_02597 [bacterium BMS3Abin07]|nr:hypothetical protein BMS3Abin07_02597 [bacterium BMS3Abin07]GBE32340.1 hypothetical protein BMS3Bbin05_01253 [bacterium BMS3Bbin05]HDO21703.1 hypothetical protein [Nitrospirota bacterium]HDZ87660.1 hypothetical protein [Nitrospirota bacterium]